MSLTNGTPLGASSPKIRYFMMPAVFFDPQYPEYQELNSSEKMLYTFLYSWTGKHIAENHSSENHSIKASIYYIAQIMGCSVKSVRTWIRHLNELEMISIHDLGKGYYQVTVFELAQTGFDNQTTSDAKVEESTANTVERKYFSAETEEKSASFTSGKKFPENKTEIKTIHFESFSVRTKTMDSTLSGYLKADRFENNMTRLGISTFEERSAFAASTVDMNCGIMDLLEESIRVHDDASVRYLSEIRKAIIVQLADLTPVRTVAGIRYSREKISEELLSLTAQDIAFVLNGLVYTQPEMRDPVKYITRSLLSRRLHSSNIAAM